MLRRLRTISICAAALISGCGTPEVSHPLNADLAFKSGQHERELERRALTGDIDAAEFLAAHYSYYDYNKAKVLRWLKVAERNGSKTARHSIKVVEETDP